MVVLSESHKKFYSKLKSNFQNELGFPPFRKIPSKIIKDELEFSLKSYGSSFPHCNIAKHCLISFFPKPLHKNPLTEFWVLYRLVNGETPISAYVKKKITEYFELRKPVLINSIGAISDLARRMALGVPLLFPQQEVNHYFYLYVRRFANLQEFFSEGDVLVPDAIIDDIWLSRNFDVVLDEDSLLMGVLLDRIIDETKRIINKDIVWEYIQTHENIVKELGEKTPNWFNDEEEFDEVWKTILKRGGSVNFLFMSKQYIPFYTLAQTSDLLEIRKQALMERYFRVIKMMACYTNFSQNQVFWEFNGYYHNENQLRKFFEILKQNQVLQDYNFSIGKSMKQLSQSKMFRPSESKLTYKTKELKAREDLEFTLPQLLVIQFYLTQGRSKLNSNIGQMFRDFLIQQLQMITNRKNELHDFQNEKFDLDDSILPKHLVKGKNFPISDILNNTKLLVSDLVVFFELLVDIIRLVFENRNFLSFDLQSNLNLMKTFTELNDLDFNLDNLSDYIIENYEIIPSVTKKIQLITNFLYSRIYPALYIPESFGIISNKLNEWILLNDSELLVVLSELFNGIISNALPSISTSFTVGPTSYSQNSVFHPENPNLVNEAILENISRLSMVRKTSKFTISMIGPVLNSFKALWYLGEFGVFNFTHYYRASDSISTQIGYMDFYDCANEKFLDFPFEIFLNSLKKFGCPSKSTNLLSSLNSNLLISKKSISSNIKKILTKNPILPIPPYQKWKEMDSLLEESKKSNSILLERNQKLLKDIRVRINWPEIGLQEYFVITNISSSTFSIKDKVYETRKCLLLPGIDTIYSTTDTMLLNKYILRYIFPYNSPNPTMFNYLKKRNCLTNFKLIRVDKFHWNTNFMEYWTDPVVLSTRYEFLSALVKKIHVDKRYQFPITTIQHEYSKVDSFLPPETNEVKNIKQLFGKNVRKIPRERRNEYFDQIPSHLYWIEPNLSYFYKFPIQINVFLSPLSQKQMKLFIRIFSLLPYSRIYECVNHENPTEECIFAELFFFNSHIDDIYFLMKDLATLENISEFLFIPKIVELNYHDFAKNIKYYIPSVFDSHRWNSRMNRFETKKYFNIDGKPIDFVDLHRKK